MNTNDEDLARYRALCARDRRFDGLFFVGVTSTGVYCRPVCPARTPRPDRCRFFHSRGQAEEAGFRPCLRCRPEHAPGRADTESLSRLARAAAEAIDAGFLDEAGLEALAARLTVSSRHLRRAFQAELGASPLAWAQERRLALARALVMDTRLPITRVAEAAGYRSLRRFNDAFVRQLGRPPSALRRDETRAETPDEDAAFTVRLDYRPPFPWTLLLDLTRAKVLPGVETIEGERYARTVALGGARGWLSLAPDPGRPALRLTVSLSLLPVLRQVVRRVRRQWDLDARPDVIEAHLARFAPLGHALPTRAGLRLLGFWEPFEGAVRIVFGQQSSVAAATTLVARLVAKVGVKVGVNAGVEAGARAGQGPPGLTTFFPSPSAVAELSVAEIAAVGIPTPRAATVAALARFFATGGGAGMETLAALPEMPGVGPWTRALFALRVSGHPDTFPEGDLVLRRMLGVDLPTARQMAAAWSPWRSYAAQHLWARARAEGRAGGAT